MTEVQREEIRKRSAAHRSDPGSASPVDEVLELIETSLGLPTGHQAGSGASPRFGSAQMLS